MYSDILDILPPEVILHITSYTDAGDVLALKLTSKTMSSLVPQSLTEAVKASLPAHGPLYVHRRLQTLTQAKVIAIHRQLECSIGRDFPKRKLINHLCTFCGHVRPRCNFPDRQRRRLRNGFDKNRLMERICLDCQAKRFRQYHIKSRYFMLEGKQCFHCAKCEMAPPVGVEFRGLKEALCRPNWAYGKDWEILRAGNKICQTCGDEYVRRYDEEEKKLDELIEHGDTHIDWRPDDVA